jgi:tetratricopeptide (TPR) repeat protein
LNNLAVFHGGFTREAAGAVASAGLPLLLVLVNKSFLRREVSGRFIQHPLLWQYLREKAQANSPAFSQAQEGHAAYFAAFMYEREALDQSMKAKAECDEIERDLANVRAAWFWATDHGREDLLDKVTERLMAFCTQAGRYQIGHILFTYAAQTLRSQSAVHGRILRNLGHLYNWQTDYETAIQVLKESVAIAQKHHLKHDEALALSYLGHSYTFSFKPVHEIKALWHRCAQLFREAGDRLHEARALGGLAELCRDPAEREHLLRRSIELCREAKGYNNLTLGLFNLAIFLTFSYGAYQEACEHLQEATRLEEARGSKLLATWYLNFQGEVLTYAGDYAAAEACFRKALTLAETLEPGFGAWEHDHSLYGLGRLHLLRSELGQAEGHLEQALELNRTHPDPFNMATEILTSLAALALAEKKLAEATSHCQRALAELGPHEVEKYETAWIAALCRHRLGEINLAAGKLAEAEQHFRQALTLARDWHLRPAMLHLCVSFADVFGHQGHQERAASLLHLAANQPASMFQTKEAAQQRLEALPSAMVAAGQERASLLTLEAVVEEALSG